MEFPRAQACWTKKAIFRRLAKAFADAVATSLVPVPTSTVTTYVALQAPKRWKDRFNGNCSSHLVLAGPILSQ